MVSDSVGHLGNQKVTWEGNRAGWLPCPQRVEPAALQWHFFPPESLQPALQMTDSGPPLIPALRAGGLL